jgi:hypothetical protein
MIRSVIRAVCAALVGVLPACANDTPPPGAMTVQAAFPKIGSNWVVHVTHSTPDASGNQRVGALAAVQEGFGDERLMAVSTTYRDAPAYGIQSGTTVFIFNPRTFNQIATISNGKETETLAPDAEMLSWPLWVGKSWNASGTVEGGIPQTNWGYYRKVAAFEDVTVPAGTYQAFRIESSPGQNIDIGYHLTQWYAPSVAYYVKTVVSMSSRALGGPRTTTTEMVSPPKP